MCTLKHDNIISNSNNDLELVNLKLYKQKGKLILPDALKSKVIIKQHLAHQFREPLKTETKWQVKLQDNAMNWKSSGIMFLIHTASIVVRNLSGSLYTM